MNLIPRKATSVQTIQRSSTQCRLQFPRSSLQGLFPRLYILARKDYLTMAEAKLHTKILAVDANKIGIVKARPVDGDLMDEIDIQLDSTSEDAANLQLAAKQLRESDIPVAFPTETVYGLGADATRSAAVKGIYKAKQRPSDNPLIVHFASLQQLRQLLKPSSHPDATKSRDGVATHGDSEDPIPKVYHPLIKAFWPGPLTIILPNPATSPLAPEVTAGLETFGARIPSHVLALALIKLADRPIAAPSANASTKPSPTAAEHVAHDLDGRIETIIDGGPCEVGVESTVVDGLVSPPLILRPGGVSLEQLKLCEGWEDVRLGYRDSSEVGSRPKAPGMKYRHYSPRAPVVLYEAGSDVPSVEEIVARVGTSGRIGVITTKTWSLTAGSAEEQLDGGSTYSSAEPLRTNGHTIATRASGFAGMLQSLKSTPDPRQKLSRQSISSGDLTIELLEVSLGADTAETARGIFSALRELDRENVDVILVEGIDEAEGHRAAAIMNRLRKAAEVHITN